MSCLDSIGCLATAATFVYEDKAAKRGRLTGRNDEQKKVIYYFEPRGGCIGKLFKTISDADYDDMIKEKVSKLSDMQRALDKLGIDKSMVQEVKPLMLQGYNFNGNVYTKRGKDGKWRSSGYQITWVFCGDDQLYFYSYLFNLDEDAKKVVAEEYFYKDITNINHSSETVEVVTSRDPMGNPLARANVEYNSFQISAMGDKRSCAMIANEETERAIQGLKNKLREKKNG